ncbi:hypothetical protein GCM10028895_35380 [Pontibacter rugosus]
MSELNNPLFDNEREFLERQKEEYKNALMGDVDQIKSQGQEIGKKVAVAGGVLLAGWLVKRMFSGGKKKIKEAKANKKDKKHDTTVTHIANASASQDKTVIYHQEEDDFFLPTEDLEQKQHAKDSKKAQKAFYNQALVKCCSSRQWLY